MRKYILAIKYFLQGDSWACAASYAEYITAWTKRTERQIKLNRSR